MRNGALGIFLSSLLLFSSSTGTAVEFFVTCLSTHNDTGVWRFNDKGVATPYLTGIAGASGIAMDKLNNLYVASYYDSTITKVTPQGVRSIFASGLSGPWGIAFSPGGDLFVANNNNYSISRISPNGMVQPFVTIATHPGALAFDSAGNLYTPGSPTSLLKITPAGTQTTFATGVQWASSLAFDPAGTLYVNNAGSTHSIVKVSPAGVVSPFVPPDKNWGCYGIALATDGNLYVADVQNRIDRVRPSGQWDVLVPYAYGLDTPAYLVEIVPEPAASLILILGGLTLWSMSYRRNHAVNRAPFPPQTSLIPQGLTASSDSGLPITPQMGRHSGLRIHRSEMRILIFGLACLLFGAGCQTGPSKQQIQALQRLQVNVSTRSETRKLLGVPWQSSEGKFCVDIYQLGTQQIRGEGFDPHHLMYNGDTIDLTTLHLLFDAQRVLQRTNLHNWKGSAKIAGFLANQVGPAFTTNDPDRIRPNTTQLADLEQWFGPPVVFGPNALGETTAVWYSTRHFHGGYVDGFYHQNLTVVLETNAVVKTFQFGGELKKPKQ